MSTEIIYCKHGYLTVECPICREDLVAEIAALREENERLRANALVWRRWPENIPDKSGIYLIKAEGDFISIGDYDFKYDYWVADEEMVNVTHWTEIPRPEGEES